MRDIERYTKDTLKHIPSEYDLRGSEIIALLDGRGELYDVVVAAWKLGFESAYRAAKAGKLDFQK